MGVQKYAPLCSINDYKLVEGRGLAFEVNADFLGDVFEPAIVALEAELFGGGFGVLVEFASNESVERAGVFVEDSGDFIVMMANCSFIRQPSETFTSSAQLFMSSTTVTL